MHGTDITFLMKGDFQKMLQIFLNCIRFSKNDEKGQGMIEYALIIGLIILALITTIGLLGNSLANIFNKITNGLQ